MTTRQEREGNSKYQEQVLSQMLEEKYNKVCADCGTRGPTWVSINLGCFICIRCSGIHRKLGTHISKVRSISLDKWSKEQVDSFKVLGNKVVNRYYEDRLPDDFTRQVNDDYQMEQFIRNKYEKKRWVGKATLTSSRDGGGDERPSRSEKSSPPPQKLLPAAAPEFAPQKPQPQQYQQQQYVAAPPQVATGSLLMQPHVSSAPSPSVVTSPSIPSYLSSGIPQATATTTTTTPGSGAGGAFSSGMSLGAGGSAPLSMDQLLSLYAPQPMAPQAVGSVPSHGTGYHAAPNYNVRLPTQPQAQPQAMPQYYAVQPQQQQQPQYYGQPMMMQQQQQHQQMLQQQAGLYYPQQQQQQHYQQQMPMYRPN